MKNNLLVDPIFRPLEAAIARSTLQVEYRDLSSVAMDVLVSSDDVDLSLTGGVSSALAQAGGNLVRDEARSWAPLAIGAVAITTAGRLPARRIFHAAVVDNRQREQTTLSLVRQVVRRCLALCSELGFQSIAFPALGTGAAGLVAEQSAAAMMLEIAAHLAQPTAIRRVLIAIYPREGMHKEVLQQYYANLERFLFLFPRMDQLILALDQMKGNYLQQSEFEAARAANELGERSVQQKARWEEAFTAGALQAFAGEAPPAVFPARHDFEYDLERISRLALAPAGPTRRGSDNAAALREVIAMRQRNLIDLEKELALRGFSVEINRQIEREMQKISQLKEALTTFES
jgi:O-acetyl-ADP-ribose deacetylase (regulator of RNase III)